MVDVIVYSKPDCCLCDELKRQLTALRAKHPFQLQEVNILEDAEAYESFKEQIPVVFMNGKKAFKFRLDEKSFLKRLEREQEKGNRHI
ncbi:MAG: glutaredoxin family protein [Acidobacteria bacterium]|nr:glutaredoxin family protein [Acidobacteriota bacterium]